jgi:hypothetical protein
MKCYNMNIAHVNRVYPPLISLLPRFTGHRRPLFLVRLCSSTPTPHSHPASTARSKSLKSGIETEGSILKILSCIAGTSLPSNARFTLVETSSDASLTSTRNLVHSAV